MNYNTGQLYIKLQTKVTTENEGKEKTSPVSIKIHMCFIFILFVFDILLVLDKL